MTWAPLKLGNGGYIIGMDIAPDGTMVAWTDSFGGYVWDAALDQWRQVLTATAMPASVTNTLLGGSTGGTATGFDGMTVDRSNSNNIWAMYYGDLYKSTDKGLTFSTTGFVSQPATLRSDSASAKSMAPYGAIDPNNSLVAYFSTASQGLSITVNGGTSFSAVPVAAGLPTGAPPSQGIGTVVVSIGTNGTDSIAIGTGTKTFNHNSTSFGFNGEYVKVWRTSDPTQQMLGTAVSTGSTLVLTVPTTAGWTQGSGTYTDWTVSKKLTDQDQGAGCVGGGHRIVFDTTGGTVSNPLGGSGSVTKNVFVHTYGVNTWKSTDGGSTWTALAATGKPALIRQMRVDPFGVLWVLDDIVLDYPGVGVANRSNISTYSVAGAWTNNVAIDAGTHGFYSFNSLAIDPLNSSSAGTMHVVVTNGSGPMLTKLSTDGGANWTNSSGSPSFTNSTTGDVAWLTSYFSANPTAFFGNNISIFDPVTSGKLWLGTEGVWYTTPPTSSVALTITQQTRGIEEFIAVKIISPTGGTAFMTGWDFPSFYSNNFNVYPALVGKPGNAQTTLQRGYSIDWVWNSPSTLVTYTGDGNGSGHNDPALNFSAITTTGGATSAAWTQFANVASITLGEAGGHIAASSASNIVVVTYNNGGKPQYTTDGGATWADIIVSVGGTPTSGWGGFQNYATSSKTIDSDKANGNLFLYNINRDVGHGGPGDAIYKSTDGGAHWTLQGSPGFSAPNANINEQLKSSGIADVLFFTPGQQGAGSYPVTAPFYYTNNGGTSWSTVTNFNQVVTFGFGAISPGQSFPNIYAAGWYSGAYGIWMCQNFNSSTGAGTWTQLGEQFPKGIMDFPKDMDGDKVTPGQCYVFTNGGAFYWTSGGSPTVRIVHRLKIQKTN